MKLIEKLAWESWGSRPDWSNQSDYAHREGFEAGFRKARELILDMDNCSPECETSWNKIKYLGESGAE